ncbi:Nse4/EID family [Phytophthora cactorum]|nr:Nse4/EID family [Phytophthora cactorum]
MRSWFILTALIAVASSSWPSQVEAAACAEICYTTELTGFGPGGTAGCSCSGSQQGARTGSGSCSCGQCYTASGSGVVGYAVNSDGTCTFGTNCGDCDYSSASSGSTTTTPSTTSSASSTTSTTSSNSTTGSSSSTPLRQMRLPPRPLLQLQVLRRTRRLELYHLQIIAVRLPLQPLRAIRARITTTQVKLAAQRPTHVINWDILAGKFTDDLILREQQATASNVADRVDYLLWCAGLHGGCRVGAFNEDDQADASYYHQQYPRQREDAFGSSAAATPTLFPQGPPTNSRRSGSSGSFTNELKPMYANSANSGSTDRLGVGLAPVHMRNSSGDLAGMAGSYSNERILSGSYSNDRILSGSYRQTVDQAQATGHKDAVPVWSRDTAQHAIETRWRNGKRRRAPSDEEQKTQRAVDVDEEDEEEASPRRSKPRTAPPGRNRKGFLENSQLTEKDRRQVRYKERELLQSIKENANDLAKLTSDTFDTHTQELDQMYDNVCYPREANLDASNLDELNVAVTKQSQALGSSDLTKYDMTDLIRATQNACTMESQNGNSTGTHWVARPEPVSDPSRRVWVDGYRSGAQERKKAKRAQEDLNAQEAQPTEYTNKKDRKDAQARRLEILQTKLTEGERASRFLTWSLTPRASRRRDLTKLISRRRLRALSASHQHNGSNLRVYGARGASSWSSIVV